MSLKTANRMVLTASNIEKEQQIHQSYFIRETFILISIWYIWGLAEDQQCFFPLLRDRNDQFSSLAVCLTSNSHRN